MKMRFQDRVSRAIYELQRAKYPPLDVDTSKLDAFEIDMPPNVGPAMEILQSLTTLEAHDYIHPNAGGSHEAKRAVSEKLAHVIALRLLRDGLVEIEVGSLDMKGYPVRGRVRVMMPEQDK